MIDPLEVIEKLEQGGHKELTYPEQLFIVEVFKAAAKTQNEELMKVVLMIQKAHLDYCYKLKKRGRPRK